MWQHQSDIKAGTKGEISYIQEEVAELADAQGQGVSKAWTLIEASDVVAAVGKFTLRKHGCPLWLIVLLAYARLPFKLVRNRVLNLMGKQKRHKPMNMA